MSAHGPLLTRSAYKLIQVNTYQECGQKGLEGPR